LLRDPPRQAAPATTGGIAARLRAFGLILATPAVALPIAVGTMLAFVMSGVESTFVLWTAGEYGWGPRQNGYLLAYIGLVLVLAQAGLVGRLADWLGESRLAALGTLL